MNANQDIDAVVVRVLATAGPRPAPDIATLDTPLMEDGLGLSSLSLMRALVDLEERFDISLEDAALMASDLHTVRDVSTLVRREVAGSGGRAADA